MVVIHTSGCCWESMSLRDIFLGKTSWIVYRMFYPAIYGTPPSPQSQAACKVVSIGIV